MCTVLEKGERDLQEEKKEEGKAEVDAPVDGDGSSDMAAGMALGLLWRQEEMSSTCTCVQDIMAFSIFCLTGEYGSIQG